MEASGPSGKNSVSTQHTLVEIVGKAIAILTLVTPIWTIAYFSTSPSNDTISPQNYPVPSFQRMI